MVKQDSLLTKIAFLGISFVLTSAYAINGALPQMTEALHFIDRGAGFGNNTVYHGNGFCTLEQLHSSKTW